VREHAGHALIGSRQWIPRAQIEDPVRSLAMGLPPGLEFRTKGQLAIDISADALTDGITFDLFCGDEVYGNCTGLHAWSWLATASPEHCLLIRRHLKSGELAFHYCFVPAGQPLTLTRLIRAAGLRWPVEEQFRAGKDCFGLDQAQVRLYTAIARHTVLVMAALAICAITAAQVKGRTDTQAPAPVRPGQPPPADPGMIPFTVAEIARLLAAWLTRPAPPGHTACWLAWRRTHQALARWYHQRTRLTRDAAIAQLS
jgi:hypothetical protein